MQVVKWMGIGLLGGFLGLQNVVAADQSKPEPAATANASDSSSADNTTKNSRDRENATLTSGDQGHSKADRDTTAQIRRALMKNHELSMTAKNVKIITVNGKVTLRGPVKTDQERKVIDQLAHQQGVSSVDNELEVKTANK
jgi:hyperosmotically inducible protein